MIDFKKKIEEDLKKEREIQNRQNTKDLLIDQKNKRLTKYIIIILSIMIIFTGQVLVSSFDNSNWFIGGILNNFKHLIPLANKTLQGEKNDRINILLLGIGGVGHQGPYLTDTMILMSFKPSTKQISLISIPRDLVSSVSNWEKINSIDAYAESKNPGSGGQVTSQAISTLLKIPIPYYVRVDFQGFINIINELGGVKVNVTNTLDDYQYPIAGQEDNPNYTARFEHLHIAKGLQTMNGSLALKYARSRHALGIEGSDFARAHRQQLILEAVKNKLLSTQTLLNPMIIARVINQLDKSISTNLDPWEILRVWNLFKNVKHSQIISKILSNAPNNFLVAGRGQNGAYILTPRSGNFSEIQNFVKNIFLNTNNQNRNILPVIHATTSVVILNGTWISGLANRNAVLLEQAKFKVLKITNAPTRNNAKTIIYNLSSKNRNNALKVLEKITGATQSFNVPAWAIKYKINNSPIVNNLLNTSTSISSSVNSSNLGNSNSQTNQQNTTPDFLLLLGTDSNKAK